MKCKYFGAALITFSRGPEKPPASPVYNRMFKGENPNGLIAIITALLPGDYNVIHYTS